MQQDVVKTLKYFLFFDYSPTFAEILFFLTRKTNAQNLQKVIKTLIKENRLLEKDNRYTLGEYNGGVGTVKEERKIDQKRKAQISKTKVQKLRLFLKLILLCPQVKLVGLSGSVAMLNAKQSDDIDLFVITGQSRLWTGRFVCLLVASLFGRRKFQDRHTSDKICLNLFFDQSGLAIPIKKRSFYVAHEVLQIKPLIDRENTYRSFLEGNKWVFKLFPNAIEVVDLSFSRPQTRALRSFTQDESLEKSKSTPFGKNLVSSFGDVLEYLLKKFQLYFINRHKTTEIITDTQLWFFPDDFEKKLNRILPI